MARKTLAEVVRGETRFGRLTLIGEAAPNFDCNGGMIRHANFACDCGEVRRIKVASVKSGATKSCGCLHKDTAAALAQATCLKHGDARLGRRAPEYGIHQAMLNRCFNPKVERYAAYGGRGITVCAEWQGAGGYQRFLAHIGRRPSAEHSLDRIDPDGDYRPGNVRWAVKETQANNKRGTVRYAVGDRQMTIPEMSRECGVSVSTLRWRLKTGVSPEAAMTSPIKTGPYAKLR